MAAIRSWLDIAPESHFSLANIPFGIISTKINPQLRPAIAIGNYALDLGAFSRHGGFSKLPSLGGEVSVFQSSSLNAFAALGRPAHRLVRKYLGDVLRSETPYPQLLKENADLQKRALVPLAEVRNHLPLEIGDYTDFFAGRNHAFNVGTLFRGPSNALQPNYNHIPVAYHGRASSVVVSGTPLHRPQGQILQDPKAEPKVPITSPCKRLDIELEMAMFICKGNALGKRVSVEEAEEYIFGYALMNDWSARDVQVWEYVPLGPFNAKNFGTSISPWIVLADALEPFRTAGLDNKTELQSYLQTSKKDGQYNIELEVDLTSESPYSDLCSSILILSASFLRHNDDDQQVQCEVFAVVVAANDCTSHRGWLQSAGRRPLRLRHNLRLRVQHVRQYLRADPWRQRAAQVGGRGGAHVLARW